MTKSRVQLALNVDDVETATMFYRSLFGVEPSKQHPGYANFEIADPPLKLVLFENPDAASPLNHLGVEFPSSVDVVMMACTARGGTSFATSGFDRRSCSVADGCSRAGGLGPRMP